MKLQSTKLRIGNGSTTVCGAAGLRRVDAILEGDTGEGVDYQVEECVGMRFILLVMLDDRVRKTRMKSRAPRQR